MSNANKQLSGSNWQRTSGGYSAPKSAEKNVKIILGNFPICRSICVQPGLAPGFGDSRRCLGGTLFLRGLNASLLSIRLPHTLWVQSMLLPQGRRSGNWQKQLLLLGLFTSCYFRKKQQPGAVLAMWHPELNPDVGCVFRKII